MSDSRTFGLLVLVAAVVGLLAVLSNAVGRRLKLPPPILFLAAGAAAAHWAPGVHAPPQRLVSRLVTVALVIILFDGGMQIGWRRFRASALPISVAGVLGTGLTVAAAAAAAHLAFSLAWYPAVLLATAVAPTDPAVVFSVLGQREVGGSSGTILQGESGANDPVGIALMVSLLAAGGLGPAAAGHALAEFAGQLAIGGAVGVAGGRALLWFMRRVPLPAEGLYPLRTLAGALALYGAASAAHGSGFLAVFVAGIALGDGGAPYKREIERFHAALASLGEIVAFVVLGLTVHLAELGRADVWLPGVVLGALLAVVIRPVLLGLCLLAAPLGWRERAFVAFAGLKGAVPILLGSFLLEAGVPSAPRLYGIVVVVVAFSVLVQGGLAPAAARLLRVPMRRVEPEPWALGVRLRHEPEGVHRLTVAPGSAADGRAVADLPGVAGGAWVSIVVRDLRLVTVRGETVLRAGDDVLVLADPDLLPELQATFTGPGSWPAGAGRDG